MADKLDKRMAKALAGLMDQVGRKSLRKRCEGPRYVAPLILLGIALFFVVSIFNGFMRDHYGRVVALIAEWSVYAVLIFTSIFFTRFRFRRMNPRVMVRLKKLKIRPHFCLCCEYNLKGSVADHCPECGAGLAPVAEDDGVR